MAIMAQISKRISRPIITSALICIAKVVIPPQAGTMIWVKMILTTVPIKDVYTNCQRKIIGRCFGFVVSTAFPVWVAIAPIVPPTTASRLKNTYQKNLNGQW